MFTKPFATEGDVRRVLGDVDPLTASRILAIAPSVDELDEAVRQREQRLAFAEEPWTPSSARVANIRAVLAELAAAEIETERTRP